MKRIGVMSDTHGFVPRQVYDFFKDVDIIIHCGDIGSSDVLDELRLFKPVLAVYGNCDDRYAYDDVARVQYDTIEGVKIMVTHIGGYPKHYDRSIKEELQKSNCDIFFWDDVLDRALEISSMGIRVDKDALLHQLELQGKSDRKELYFHRRLLEGSLPLCIGGGIGQSRLCMILLHKAHVGETQSSIWPDDMRKQCKELGMTLI